MHFLLLLSMNRFLQPSKMEEEEAEAEAEEETPVPKYDDLISIRAIKMGKGGLKSLLEDDSKRVARLSLSEQTLKNAVITLGTDIVRSVKAIYSCLFKYLSLVALSPLQRTYQTSQSIRT